MLESYLRLGMTQPATFSLFARPSRRRPFLVVCGLAAALEALRDFRFGPEQLDYLRAQGLSSEAIDWLARFEPEGELWAMPDGTVALPSEPLLEMTAPLPVAQLLETALMNAVHAGTLVATKAARLVRAAAGRAVVDFGFRRAHGLETGVQAALAAYVGGCASSSNVEAGRRYGIPIAGTMAHSFVQAFDSELVAFQEFAHDHPGTTLLVDTFDTSQGVDNAIEIARSASTRIGAIRIDSEPLLELSREARAKLDAAGLRHVTIFASGGLDEDDIRRLVAASAPITAFGVGSALVCSTDKAALDVAYKLVEYAGQGRAKYSRGKAIWPGKKQVYRAHGPESDVLELRDASAAGSPLLELVWRDGQSRYELDPAAARARAIEAVAKLPEDWFHPERLQALPAPAIGPGLAAEAERVRRRVFAR